MVVASHRKVGTFLALCREIGKNPKTKRALGRAHLPPTKIFRRLSE